MNITTLIDTISEAVAQDTDIKAWCQTTYSSGHTVYINVDERDLPGEDGCPYVALWPVTKKVGRQVTRKPHGVEVFCCIHDESERAHGTISNIVEFAGVKRIEDLRKLVETAIAGIDLGNASLRAIDIEYDTISEFPFHYAGMLIEIIETVCIGGDHLS